LIQQNDIESWLLKWIADAHGGNLPGTLDEDGNAVLVDAAGDGWLDSFGVIELITAAEDEFTIRFSEEEFRDPNFMTVKGFAMAAERKLRAL